MNSVLNLKVPKVYEPLWKEQSRYYGLRGGRGSAKSWAVADHILTLMLSDPNKSTVCLREIQKSIKYSSKKLIEDRIESLGISDYFEVLTTEIRAKQGSGVIIFQGLQDHTADSIKSLEGFSYAWIEEAQTITKHSLSLLTPTIRKDGSKLFFTWNPKNKDDAVEQVFYNKDNSIVINSSYLDNPYCPKSIKDEANEMMKKDYEEYLHVYKGDFRTISDAQVMKDKFTVKDFEVDEYADKLYGLDFGFAQDPLAGIACYVKDNTLYIYNESGGVGIEIVDNHLALDAIIDSERDLVYGDSARPEVISYLNKQGYNVASVKKWKGSVEDGISTLRSFDHIIIHPSCERTANEFAKYSYKVDRAGNITSVIIDKDNHWMDALRYAISDLIITDTDTYGFMNNIF